MTSDNCPGKYTDKQLRELETEISNYIRWEEGRGCFCHCHEPLSRLSTREECFFISLSDHPHSNEEWNNEGRLTVAERWGAFEIAILYNWETRQIKIRASGTREHKTRLCRIWAHFMKHTEISEAEAKRDAFDIEQFRNLSMPLSIENLPGVKNALVTSLGLEIKGNRASLILVEDEEGNIQQKLDYNAEYNRHPLSTMNVYYLKNKVLLDDCYGRSKRQTIEVYGDRCNVPSLNIKVQDELNKALREWKIAV